MPVKNFYLVIIMGLMATAAKAQTVPDAPVERQLYCDGIVTNQALATDSYVISGVESNDRVIYYQGDYVFLNRGADQGVKVGDQFQVSRPASDPLHEKWFAYQNTLLAAMGKTYQDIARVRVVNVQPKVSIALVTFSCDPINRGDLIQPFMQRNAPTFKPATAFDQFAPSSGKAKAMIVTTLGFGQLVAKGTIVYVNLGSGQGVKVGDYFRVFRYQEAHHDEVFSTKGTAYQLEGQGSTPVPYTWADLPRDVLGEGIVLRAAPNAATVLITTSQRAMYAGDYVELE